MKMAVYIPSLATIVYILVILSGNVSSAEECEESFNPALCAVEMYCTNAFQPRHTLINYKRNNYRQQYYYRGESPGFDNCGTISLRGNDFYPIRLIYNDLNVYYEDAIELFVSASTNYKEVIDIITYMDLRNNSYTTMPSFTIMESLDILKLSNNSLSVAVLPDINVFPVLTEIDFSHNTIQYIQSNPEGVHIMLSKLKKIDLSYNYLDVLPDAVFDPYKELQTLDLSHNNINVLNQFTFEGNKQLIYLNLSFNKISDVNLSLFRFSALKLLDLSFNNIKQIRANDFNKLVSLKTLDLRNNFIAIVEKDTFYNMNTLASLYLNNNKLINIDKDAFNNAGYLVNIDISNNNMKKLPKGLFKNKTIHSFSIADNKLEGSLDRGTFEGLSFLNELDLSYQNLDSVGDYAFFGLDRIEVLLLNNNKIAMLTSKCFRMNPTLKKLDLSFNEIQTVDFEKADLCYLYSLSLRNNKLTVVKQESFHGLNSLQFLDLSNNKIKQLDTNSFQSLKELINFQISNNPLSGILKQNTFDGLNSLPRLDISRSLLKSFQNGSFSGMSQLKDLNVSHGKIDLLEYNSFVHTGTIEIIDLSYNSLKEFAINSTELAKLDTLYLNNNLIKMLSSDTFRALTRLSSFSLSHNMIENVDDHIFSNKKYLRELDLSYNPLSVTMSLLNDTKTVNILKLSGIRTAISFENIKDIFLKRLSLSNSSVTDVKKLHINELQHLEFLKLSENDLSKLEYDGFSKISTLKYLDVSHNKITYIQPGVFKDNVLLFSLNMSSNLLTDIPYGIFKGLIYLHTLDISYNNIRDLADERFFDTSSLSVLIADHNKIDALSVEEFLGTSLTYLSIGDNLIPCDHLVNLNRSGVSFQVTAQRLDYYNHENFHGISCNKKVYLPILTNVTFPVTADSTKVLINIRDILLNLYNSRATSTANKDEKYILSNITDHIEKSNANIDAKITKFMNTTLEGSLKNNETNGLLQKILRVLTLNSARKTPSIEIPKGNATYDSLVLYINKIKQDLEESLTSEKANIINDMETRILTLNSQLEDKFKTNLHEKESLVSNETKSSLFTETCVGLILIILVCFVLFKIYKSGVFARQSFSVSTRELPGAMDSSL